MADIFLSYSPLDMERVEKVVRELERRGSSVAWFRSGNLDADEAIRLDGEMASASWIVVLWSQNALQDGRITFEAMQARETNRLISVQLEENTIPLDYNNAENPQLIQYQEQLTGIMAELFGDHLAQGTQQGTQPDLSSQEVPEEDKNTNDAQIKTSLADEEVISDGEQEKPVEKTESTAEVEKAEEVGFQVETEKKYPVEELPAKSMSPAVAPKIEEKLQAKEGSAVKETEPVSESHSPEKNAELPATQFTSADKKPSDTNASAKKSSDMGANLSAALAKAQAFQQDKKGAETAPKTEAETPQVPIKEDTASFGSLTEALEKTQEMGASNRQESSVPIPSEMTAQGDLNNGPVKRSNFMVPAGLVFVGLTMLGSVGGGYYYMATTPPPAESKSVTTVETVKPQKTSIKVKPTVKPKTVQKIKPKPVSAANDPILQSVLAQLPKTPVAKTVANRPVSLADKVAQADPVRGGKHVKKCVGCHSFDKGGATKAGPNLHNVVGQLVGSASGYEYSDTLRSMGAIGETWNIQQLDCYLKDPEGCMPGTTMGFNGIKRSSVRADIISYLTTLNR